MPPKAPSLGTASPASEKWVKATWMPHTTLSQTSHVCLSIRSAHTCLDRLNDKPQEWTLRAGIYGIAGLPLVPVSSITPASPLRLRKPLSSEGVVPESLRPTVFKATHDCCWDYFIQMPVRWRDLPRDAYLLFEVLLGQHVIYQTTMPFFSQFGKLATGLQRLQLQSDPLDSGRNHGLVALRRRQESDEDEDDPVWKASCILDQLQRFEQRSTAPGTERLSAFGEVPSVPWLDAMQKKRAMQVLADALNKDEKQQELIDVEGTKSYLIVELPVFDIPIMHEENFYPIPQQGASGAVAPLDLSVYRKQASQKATDDPNYFDPLQLVPFLDYENEHDNPVEDKYRTLAHDLLRGLVDPALKPDREQRDKLAAIIDSPSHHPTREEKDLLWRFRFSLVDNRRALTKFLVAVDWTVESEVVQAAELLEQWRKRSPIEVTDALKLLGKHVAFQTNLVRSYAIDTLAEAPDSELRLYLLQLVQALKYENMEIPEPATPTRIGSNSTSVSVPRVSSLATFLINRAANNVQLANFLYWYIKVELQNPTHGAKYRDVFAALKARLSETPFKLSEYGSHEEDSTATPFKSIVDSVSKLGHSFRVGEHGSNEKDRSAKKRVKRRRTVWEVLVAQDNFISGIMDIQLRCRDARGKKDAKEEQLKSLLSKEGYNKNPHRDPTPLPSAPDILVNGVHPETVTMFKSALYPALVDFYVEGMIKAEEDSQAPSGKNKGLTSPRLEEHLKSYKVIVKTGDDLRQDQLIIMMIQLMDGLLKRAALDLCLTPYSVIAMSPTSGLVEFVDGSMPISQILSQYNGSILQFFQSAAPQKGAKYDVRPDVMAAYVRSCAGYCVITYLLGVGDRHLDNILLRASGHFFHIDFGFVFGRDPKPLPPAFRLTREMVDGMGGVDSSEYRQFCSLACQAFNALRKSAGLVLNLLHLMSDAGIEDLSNNPAMDAEGVLAKVEERFRLDLNDEQAERYFVGLINDCLAALAPRVMDVFHSFSVARR